MCTAHGARSIRIALKRGVCGKCARDKKTIVVKDVHQFEGHIACDARTNSELVVPMLSESGELIGVLDVDSLQLDAFSDDEVRMCEKMASAVAEACDWTFLATK